MEEVRCWNTDSISYCPFSNIPLTSAESISVTFVLDNHVKTPVFSIFCRFVFLVSSSSFSQCHIWKLGFSLNIPTSEALDDHDIVMLVFCFVRYVVSSQLLSGTFLNDLQYILYEIPFSPQYLLTNLLDSGHPWYQHSAFNPLIKVINEVSIFVLKRALFWARIKISKVKVDSL